jgi:integrase/recombinase XerC
MKLEEIALLRGWIKHVDWSYLDGQLSEEGSAKKKIKALRKSLVQKARFYQKTDWESFWQSERLPTLSWEAKALHSFNSLINLPEAKASETQSITQWLSADICRGLPEEITTLGDLMDYLDGYYAGQHGLPDSFQPRLNFVTRFFKTHASALNRELNRSPLTAHNKNPLSQQLTLLPALRPIQDKVRDDLIIDAQTDVEAAAIWLKAKGGRSINTFDAYRREATRLLLWLGENNLTLSELKVNHIELYFAHLVNPPPHWLRPRKPKRHDNLQPTQVLAGSLSAKSIDQSRVVLGQLCGYLQQAGYLRHNVFRLVSRPVVIKQTVVTRLLDFEAWQWLWQWVLRLPQETDREKARAIRTRWLFALLYHTGIRREEAANGRMGDFIRKDQAWTLRVVGKGNKEKFVTINSSLYQELMLYRRALGLRETPSPAERMPLVASVNNARKSAAMTPRAVGWIIYTIGNQAASECQDDHIKAQIAHMTTHWLRHTNATHRLMAGASLETTQDELGHADPRTTRIYAKTTDRQKQEDAEKLAHLNQAVGEISR